MTFKGDFQTFQDRMRLVLSRLCKVLPPANSLILRSKLLRRLLCPHRLSIPKFQACFSVVKSNFYCLYFYSCVFLPNSGAFFVNYVVTSALIGTALELLRFPELVVYAVRMCYTKNEGERLLVKKVFFLLTHRGAKLDV